VSAILIRAKCALAAFCSLLPTTPAKSQVVVLHNLTGTSNDGSGAVGSLVPFGSALYGMTKTDSSAGFGNVFRINPDGTGLTLPGSFVGGPKDGSDLLGTLAQSSGVL
jgi:uncharacterized repeat protein (TIGR03803 family)